MLILFFLILYSFQFYEEAKLTASDAAYFDFFGWSVSISGDYAIIGAFGNDDNSGSAYIFYKSGSTWIQQKLTALDAYGGDSFGYSVSISGDYAIVGALNDDEYGTSSGSAYIFYRNDSIWTQQQKLTASDAGGGDQFGVSVSISGNYAIVGANKEDGSGSNSGSAYIFYRTGLTWTEQQKLTASDASDDDYFGTSVSISGNYSIVGVHQNDDNSGSAYIFYRNDSTWTEQQKLTALDADTNDYFGWSVSISGNYAIVGANKEDGSSSNSGSAYIFYRNDSTWTEQQKLTALDASVNDEFGYSVSISDDYAIVSALNDGDSGSNSGSAYIFYRNDSTWTEQQKLTASDASSGDFFGRSVSISGNYVIIGADGDDVDGGSAYIFNKDSDTNSDTEINSDVDSEINSDVDSEINSDIDTDYKKISREKLLKMNLYLLLILFLTMIGIVITCTIISLLLTILSSSIKKY